MRKTYRSESGSSSHTHQCSPATADRNRQAGRRQTATVADNASRQRLRCFRYGRRDALSGIIYRLEAAKPGMAAVKAGVKTASVASTLGKTAATATTQTGAQVLAGSAQRAGQTMKNVLRATQVTGGKADE